MVVFSHFFARGRKLHRYGGFSQLSFLVKRKLQRKHAKTFFPRKKVLESKKGVGTTTKLTLVGTGTDGKAV